MSWVPAAGCLPRGRLGLSRGGSAPAPATPGAATLRLSEPPSWRRLDEAHGYGVPRGPRGRAHARRDAHGHGLGAKERREGPGRAVAPARAHAREGAGGGGRGATSAAGPSEPSPGFRSGPDTCPPPRWAHPSHSPLNPGPTPNSPLSRRLHVIPPLPRPPGFVSETPVPPVSQQSWKNVYLFNKAPAGGRGAGGGAGAPPPRGYFFFFLATLSLPSISRWACRLISAREGT